MRRRTTTRSQTLTPPPVFADGTVRDWLPADVWDRYEAMPDGQEKRLLAPQLAAIAYCWRRNAYWSWAAKQGRDHADHEARAAWPKGAVPWPQRGGVDA